jgi:hypothetical protein
MTAIAYPTYTQDKNSNPTDVKIETNTVIADTTRMQVDSSGAAHIMSLLTDLYSDPTGTVIREYISNAYDSHAEAGTDAPIEVTLPSKFEPKFIIKDHGTGMSAQEVRDIYGVFGRSTKRTDNTQVGAFGLGSKSALTMTQQFTAIFVKDGEKTVALIARGEDGVGEIKILSVTETDEGNGVTITIPVTKVTDFNEKANAYFFTLPKNTILVDGKAPERSLYSSDYLRIDELDTYIARNNEARPDKKGWGYVYENGFYVVMGGVSYEVRTSELYDVLPNDVRHGTFMRNITNHYGLRTYSIVPIASVDLVPSREDIRYSPRTKKFLASLFEAIGSEFTNTLAADISEADTRKEAFKRLAAYSKKVNGDWINNVNWNGEVIPNFIEDIKHARIHYSESSNSSSVGQFDDLPARDYGLRADDSFLFAVVKADTDAEWLEACNKARRDWKGYLFRNEEDGEEDNYDTLLLFRDEAPTSPWFTEMKAYTEVSLEDIIEGATKWRKYRRTVGNSNRTYTASAATTYPYLTLAKDTDTLLSFGDVLAKEIPSDALYVSEGNLSDLENAYKYRLHERSHENLITLIKAIGLVDVKIVYLKSSRKVETLHKRAGRTMDTLTQKVYKFVSDLEKSLSQDAKDFYSSFYYEFSTLCENISKFEPFLDDIDDDDLRRVHSIIAEVENYQTLLNSLGRYSNIRYSGNSAQGAEILGTLSEKYPLVDFSSRMRYTVDHAVLYMTAVNTNRKDA